MAAAPFPASIRLPPGGTRGTARLASKLKPKGKGKDKPKERSQSLDIPVLLSGGVVLSGLSTAVVVMYAAAGDSSEPPKHRGTLALRAANMLVPTPITVVRCWPGVWVWAWVCTGPTHAPLVHRCR